MLAERFEGKQQALVKRSGLTKGRIAQLLDDDEPFGERAARTLALKLGFAENFFEREHPNPAHELREPGPESAYRTRADDLAAKWDLLIEEQREAIMAEIDKLVHQNQVAFEHLKKMKLDKFIPDPQVAEHLPLPPAQKDLPIELPVPSGEPKRGKKR